MIKNVTIAMYEKAEEIQTHFTDIDNRLGEGFVMWYFQYPAKGMNWEVFEHYGLVYMNSEDYPSEKAVTVWLPEAKHFESMIPHIKLIDLDDKFDEFKRMYYESHWFSNEVDTLEGRGDDPFVYFKTYDELWLGFVMMDRYRKRWDGLSWVTTDIYPDYFKMNALTACEDGYPAPDRLKYIPGLRGIIEK